MCGMYFSLQQYGCEILNEKRNFTVAEYQRMFEEQLQIERNGTIKIKSIAKFANVDNNTLYYVSSAVIIACCRY